MSARLGAIYHATAVEVACPTCGETLPAPDGSLFWTVDELSIAIERAPERTCDSCDESFVLRQENRAHLHLSASDPRADAAPPA